jgi:hypothetical protein
MEAENLTPQASLQPPPPVHFPKSAVILGVVTQTGKMRHVMRAFLSTSQALSLE